MEHFVLALELLGMALIVATVWLLWLNIRDFWGEPTAAAFIYYCAATVLLGLIKVFLHLAESHTLGISDATATLGWHLMFYLAMAMFIAGTTALLHVSVGTSGTPKRPFSRLILRGKFPVLVGVVVFAGSVLADNWITKVFADSLADRSGFVHFLAFAMSIAVVYAMRRLRKNLGQYVRSIATPIIWAVFFLGVVHFWELLTESWAVLTVSHETIEIVEIFLTLPALALIFYAFLRTRRRIG